MAAEKSLVLNSSQENDSKKSCSRLIDILIIGFSICTLLIDLGTDILLVVEYFNKEYYSWAWLTLALLILPLLVVEGFSFRWHSQDGNDTLVTRIAHIFLLGIAHRYVEAIRAAVLETPQLLLSQQRDLCLLHLFNSFLESAPQLILQLYITATLGALLPWTGISLVASLFSLAWAIASYTRAMRRSRPDKKPASSAALASQATWRAGTLTARILSLTALALISPMWMMIFLGLHWLGMTIWAIAQRTDFCSTWWEERGYNMVVGVIYCFCFFNLQEGPSRYRAFIFYSVTTLENAVCVAAFALWGKESAFRLTTTHNDDVKLLVLIVALSTFIGLSSMLLYYAFFHPAGIIFPCMPKDDLEARHNLSDDVGRSTLRSLRHVLTTTPESSPQRSQLSAAVTLSSAENSPAILEQPEKLSLENELVQSSIPESHLSEQQLKRRPICDISLSELDGLSPPRSPILPVALTVTLATGLNSRSLAAHLSSRFLSADLSSRSLSEDKEEVYSTCPSAHDYENMCAVGITRETWGLRHWDGYSSNIATHDTSVARLCRRDPRRDTLVSSSTYSSLSSNYSDSESETYIYVRPMGLPLDPIAEESIDDSSSENQSSGQHASCSSLVTTIEEIRLSQDLFKKVVALEEPTDEADDWLWQPLSQTEIDFLARLQPTETATDEPTPRPLNRLRRKFSLLRDRFELPTLVESKKEVEIVPVVEKAVTRVSQWDNLARREPLMPMGMAS
ncbi:XK-related protein 5-like [Cloeon dipterum]|uniref:XK-related protein 5-like n=1 Tax=Cloeon dipterum TaxID=197152 RepID=UPI00321FD1E1